MQIVTNSGVDLLFSEKEMARLRYESVPLKVTLDDITYREGIDIEKERFYALLEASKGLPITSQPSPGDFAEVYRRLAEQDPEILSIHMSTGLSGTYNSAREGMELVPEANITLFDTKTLAGGPGWIVAAACHARDAGWSMEQILPLLEQIRSGLESIFTLNELKYLIHGGRISHIKGLLASLLDIKPVIHVEKSKGIYEQAAQARTFKKAVSTLVDQVVNYHPEGSHLRTQVMHSANPQGAQMLVDEVDRRYKCNWLPTGPMSLVLGAHTGQAWLVWRLLPKRYSPKSHFSSRQSY